MSDLVEWLTKILDEGEAEARAAISPARGGLLQDSGVWETYHGGGVEDAASGDVIVYDEGAPSPEQADFIAANDPASVLADIAAKRAIIAEYVARDEDADLMLGPDCLRQREWIGLRLAVQLMATGYADRAGYDESWRP